MVIRTIIIPITIDRAHLQGLRIGSALTVRKNPKPQTPRKVQGLRFRVKGLGDCGQGKQAVLGWYFLGFPGDFQNWEAPK